MNRLHDYRRHALQFVGGIRNMDRQESIAAPSPRERQHQGRAWPRARFRLRTLLLLPLVVAALLLIAFPKLRTGDYVEATVVSIEDKNGTLNIERGRAKRTTICRP
jgi:hypothetical protein